MAKLIVSPVWLCHPQCLDDAQGVADPNLARTNPAKQAHAKQQRSHPGIRAPSGAMFLGPAQGGPRTAEFWPVDGAHKRRKMGYCPDRSSHSSIFVSRDLALP